VLTATGFRRNCSYRGRFNMVIFRFLEMVAATIFAIRDIYAISRRRPLGTWEMAIFDPLQIRHPSTVYQNICHRWLRRRPLHLRQIRRTSFHGGLLVAAWRSGSVVGLDNEVNLRWARLVLGWVTVSGFDSRRRYFISVCNQPPRSTQPSTLRGTVKWVPAKGRWCSAAGE